MFAEANRGQAATIRNIARRSGYLGSATSEGRRRGRNVLSPSPPGRRGTGSFVLCIPSVALWQIPSCSSPQPAVDPGAMIRSPPELQQVRSSRMSPIYVPSTATSHRPRSGPQSGRNAHLDGLQHTCARRPCQPAGQAGRSATAGKKPSWGSALSLGTGDRCWPRAANVKGCCYGVLGPSHLPCAVPGLPLVRRGCSN